MATHTLSYSQHGEDAIIRRLCELIPTPHKLCVEFGAFDGKSLSNTFYLVANLGWRAIYIEADKRRFRKLRETASEFSRIQALSILVTPSGPSSLDAILSQQSAPSDFEVLSIDVDGADYEIWEGLSNFRPSIVIVEHNQTMPPGFEYVDRGGRGFIGSSAISLYRLARRKGYDLVECTTTNSIFLREDLFAVAKLKPRTVAEAFDQSDVCYVFRNYAGDLVFSNPGVASSVAGIRYAAVLKRLKHALLRKPSSYELGQSWRQDNALVRGLQLCLNYFRR
jgi:hypothetical protein